MALGKKRRGGRRHRRASKAKTAAEELHVVSTTAEEEEEEEEEEHQQQEEEEACCAAAEAVSAAAADEEEAGDRDSSSSSGAGGGRRRDRRDRRKEETRQQQQHPRGRGEDFRQRNGLWRKETGKFVPGDGFGEKRRQNDRRHGSGHANNFIEYFTHVREVLEQKMFHSDEEWETFLTATTEEIATNAQLLLCDRRCSKVVEKIIGLVAELLTPGGRSIDAAAASEEGGGGAAAKVSPSVRDEERIEAVLHAFAKLLRQIVSRAGQLATDPTGSHVLQTLLLSLSPVLLAEAALRRARRAAAAAAKEEDTQLQQQEQTIEDLTLYCLHCLQAETGGWLSLMRDACGSHVLRAAVAACAGFYAPQVVLRGGRRAGKELEEALLLLPAGEPHSDGRRAAAASDMHAAGKGRRTTAAGEGAAAPPPRPLHVSPLLLAVLKSLALETAAAVEADAYTLLFDIYASPAIQLLLAVLDASQACADEQAKLLAAVLRMPITAVEGTTYDATTPTQEALENMQQLADALINSAVGSRVLEIAAPLLRSPPMFQRFFSAWVSKRLNSLAQGKFGNFFLQKLLASPVLQAPHLLQIISTLDVRGCIEAETSGVLWRVAEACRRLREGYSPFTKKLWAAVGLSSSFSSSSLSQKQQQHSHPTAAARHVWLCILALKPPAQLSPQLLLHAAADHSSKDTHHLSSSSSSSEATAAAAAPKAAAATAGGGAAAAGGAAGTAAALAVGGGDQEEEKKEEAAFVSPLCKREGGEGNEERKHVLRHLREFYTPMGLSLLMSLLRFPPASVQPLVLGFKGFLATLRRLRFLSRKPRHAVQQQQQQQQQPVFEEIPLLLRLATDPQGSRFLEAVIRAAGGPTGGGGDAAAKAANSSKHTKSAAAEAEAAGRLLLPPAAVQRLAKAFAGSYAVAALHPAAAFVVGSLYEAAALPMKRRIVEELLPVEDELREKNYKLYRICELYRYKQSEEAWTERQQKKSKMRSLFSDLLREDDDGPAPDLCTDSPQAAAAAASSPWTSSAAASASACKEALSTKKQQQQHTAADLRSTAEENAEETAEEQQQQEEEGEKDKDNGKEKKKKKKSEEMKKKKKNKKGQGVEETWHAAEAEAPLGLAAPAAADVHGRLEAKEISAEMSGSSAEGAGEAGHKKEKKTKHQQQRKREKPGCGMGSKEKETFTVDSPAAAASHALAEHLSEQQPRKKKKWKRQGDSVEEMSAAAAVTFPTYAEKQIPRRNTAAAAAEEGEGGGGGEVDSLDAALYFIESTRKGLSNRELNKRKKIEAEKVARVTGIDITN